jgi:transposase InsO family protein
LSSSLGLNQFEREMSVRGYALKPYKSYIKTTDSRGHHYKYDNFIAGMLLQGENQVIVGDITYYQNASGLYYIFHFIDYYTLEVKGLVGSINMEGINAEKCLRQVFDYNNKRNYNYQLFLHTDGGSQYRSHNFQKMLRRAQIRPSHAQNCLENGLSERENGILKNEYLVDYDIKSVSHLNRVLDRIKQQINEVWPSKTLGYRTPKQYAEWTREMSKNKRPSKTVKIVE